MVLIPTVTAAILWSTDPSSRDSDMTGVQDLIFFFLMILTAPLIVLALGVLAPAAIALDRLARGQTSRLANALLGITLSVPALVAFSVGVALTRAVFTPMSFVDALIMPLSKDHLPVRLLITLGIFAIPGDCRSRYAPSRTRRRQWRCGDRLGLGIAPCPVFGDVSDMVLCGQF